MFNPILSQLKAMVSVDRHHSPVSLAVISASCCLAVLVMFCFCLFNSDSALKISLFSLINCSCNGNFLFKSSSNSWKSSNCLFKRVLNSSIDVLNTKVTNLENKNNVLTQQIYSIKIL